MPRNASSPIRKLEDILLVNVPGELVDSSVRLTQRQVLEALKTHRSRLLLLDFSEVVICDSYFGRFVETVARMSQLMGARVVVCGLSDAVVETMVEMGFELPATRAFLDLDDAIAFARRTSVG